MIADGDSQPWTAHRAHRALKKLIKLDYAETSKGRKPGSAKGDAKGDSAGAKP